MKSDDKTNTCDPTDEELNQILSEECDDQIQQDLESEKDHIANAIKDIEKYSDFEINNVIDLSVNHEKYSALGVTYVVPDWILTTAIIVWQKRHPITLPPCFGSFYTKKKFLGSYIPAYEWPQA
jgi:hypothetical protein